MSEAIWAAAPPRPPPTSAWLSGGQAAFTSPRDFQTSLVADVRKAGAPGLTLQRRVFVLNGFTPRVGRRGRRPVQRLPSPLGCGHPAGPPLTIWVCVWRKGLKLSADKQRRERCWSGDVRSRLFFKHHRLELNWAEKFTSSSRKCTFPLNFTKSNVHQKYFSKNLWILVSRHALTYLFTG